MGYNYLNFKTLSIIELKCRSCFTTYFNIIAVITIIVAGLVNTECFYSSTAAAYYGFCISVLLLIIGTAFFNSSKAILVLFKAPINCIAQIFDWLKSQNRLFAVNSSWNVTAISPVVPYKLDYRSKIKKTNSKATVLKDAKITTPSNISAQICFIVSSILLFSCLINLKVFIHSGLFNYVAFVLGSGSILTAVFFWKYRTIQNTIQIYITLPFVLFLVWALFVFIQSECKRRRNLNAI